MWAGQAPLDLLLVLTAAVAVEITPLARQMPQAVAAVAHFQPGLSEAMPAHGLEAAGLRRQLERTT